MIKLDSTYLEQTGLKGLPPGESEVLLRHVYETLELRVGVALADRMSSRQMEEFDAFMDVDDKAGALAWLERTAPDYRDVVARELDTITAELRQVAPTILTILGD